MAAFTGFKHNRNLGWDGIRVEKFIVAGGYTLTEGDAVSLVTGSSSAAMPNGTVRPMATNGVCLGVVRTRGATTGGEEVEIQLVTRSGGAIFEVDDNGLAAALLVKGLTLDVASGGAYVATPTNSDLRIYSYDSDTGIVEVMFLDPVF